MRILLNTLYITTENAYLSLEGENVVIWQEKTQLGRVPFHNISGIITFGYGGASPALMGACAKRGIALAFLSRSGRFLAQSVGEPCGNVLLRKEQYRISDSGARSLDYAKSFLIGKIYNARWVIERTARDHSARLDAGRLKKASGFLADAVKRIGSCSDLDILRGVEGEAASVYFGVLDDMILQQKDAFTFRSRNKRPPLDPVNAMLSFAYTLLAHDCSSALLSVGLDPYVGFLHRDRPGRISLALDLMEEFRAIYADRFVLTLINKRQVCADDFFIRENGAVVMKDEARRNFLSLWQKKKQETLTHPFLEEKIIWGLVPFVQAQLLARRIRGDLDAYPPFLWK